MLKSGLYSTITSEMCRNRLPPCAFSHSLLLNFTFQNIPMIKANPAPSVSHPETSQTTSIRRPPQSCEVIAYNLPHAEQASRSQGPGSEAARAQGGLEGLAV